jgi:hypothetical protein
VVILGRHEFLAGADDMAVAAGRMTAGWSPMGPWFIANALKAAGSILVCALVLTTSAALGERLIRFLARRKLSANLRMTTPFLGYAVLSVAIFGVAAVGLCSWGLIAGFGVIAVALTWRQLAGSAVGGWRIVRRAIQDAPAPAAGFALLVLMSLPGLLLPEINDDCLSYHQVLPQQLLLRHRLPDLPGYWAWSHPLLADYPNVFAVGLGVDAAVRMTGVALALMGTLACLRVLMPGLAGGWMALLGLAVLLVPFENWVLFTAKNDAMACGFLLAAAAMCLEAGVWRERTPRVDPVSCAALLAGCALAAKYTHGPVIVVGVALALLRAGWRPLWRSLAWLAMAALPIVPWLAWSWIRHNDPLHPFGASTLPGWFGVGGNGEAIRAELAGMLSGRLGKFRSALDAGAILGREAYPAVAVLPLLVVRSDPAIRWALSTALGGTFLAAVVIPGSHAQMPRYIFAAAVILNLIQTT